MFQLFSFLSLPYKGGFSRSPNSGGGSGGSIWIQAEYFDGDGTLDIGGGSGDGGGGGGAGGFAAIYYTYNHYSGELMIFGIEPERILPSLLSQ